MSRQLSGLVGREDELAAVDDVVGNAVLVVVLGASGIGKSAFLDEVSARCRGRGERAITIRLDADEMMGDRFGVRAVLRAFRDVFDDVGDPRLAAALARVDRMPIRPADGFAWSEDNVLHELGRLFESFRGTGPAVVLFDDVRFAPDALHVTVAAALRGGCTVVAGCHDDGGTALPLPFGASADRVLDLEPLADQAVDQLVAATVGQPVDPAVGPAVRAALGSLAGNPGAVLAVCDRLRLQRGLVYAKGAWCLADPATPIGLPPEHWLVRTAEQVATNGPQLVTLIAGVDRFTVDDLIDYVAVTGHDLDKCGRAVDDLTAVGALSHTSGVDLTVACPALATTLLAAADARQLRDLHRKIAGHLLRRNGDPALDLAKVAGHLAAAGAPATTDPAAASLLAREAGKVLPTNPALAARWYRAALAHVDSENPLYQRILAPLLRLLVRIGRYDWLAEVVTEVVAAGDAVDLARHACLAAVHTGVPLSGDIAASQAMAVIDRWCGSAEPVSGAELLEALGLPQAGEAAQWYDPVVMFESAMGPAYGPPVTGPLAHYHQVVDGYRSGHWVEALSAARALEVSGDGPPHLRELARLLAAEMCARTGEVRVAADWLSESAADCRFPVLRGWVETGLRWREGHPHAAFESGWRVFANVVTAGDPVGSQLLITRLALLAAVAGSDDRLDDLRAKTRSLRALQGGPGFRAGALAVRALAEGSHAAACTLVDEVRNQGDQPELATACLVATMTAGDPRSWLRETDEIAVRLADSWLRTTVKTVMRTRGVTLERQQPDVQSVSEVEARIIALVQEGKTNRQIGVALRLSEKSVERHLTRLFAKTGCRSRLGLVVAIAQGSLLTACAD